MISDSPVTSVSQDTGIKLNVYKASIYRLSCITNPPYTLLLEFILWQLVPLLDLTFELYSFKWYSTRKN